MFYESCKALVLSCLFKVLYVIHGVPLGMSAPKGTFISVVDNINSSLLGRGKIVSGSQKNVICCYPMFIEFIVL